MWDRAGSSLLLAMHGAHTAQQCACLCGAGGTVLGYLCITCNCSEKNIGEKFT